MIAIVDYGLGNLASVKNAFRAVGANAVLGGSSEALQGASGIVLPGVGAAGAGMARLKERGLDRIVYEAARTGTPLLGLCLGMQLLFERSDEGDAACLGLLQGSVRRLDGPEKVPHIGWNQVALSGHTQIWRNVPPNPYFYFVHSYICEPAAAEVQVGETEYGSRFCSAVAHGTIWGTQFHPERSGQVGLQVIRNFADFCTRGTSWLP